MLVKNDDLGEKTMASPVEITQTHTLATQELAVSKEEEGAFRLLAQLTSLVHEFKNASSWPIQRQWEGEELRRLRTEQYGCHSRSQEPEVRCQKWLHDTVRKSLETVRICGLSF